MKEGDSRKTKIFLNLDNNGWFTAKKYLFAYKIFIQA